MCFWVCFFFDKERCFPNNLTLPSDQGAPRQVRAPLLTGPLSTHKHEAALQPHPRPAQAAGGRQRGAAASNSETTATPRGAAQTWEAHGWAARRAYNSVRELIFTFFPQKQSSSAARPTPGGAAPRPPPRSPLTCGQLPRPAVGRDGFKLPQRKKKKPLRLAQPAYAKHSLIGQLGGKRPIRRRAGPRPSLPLRGCRALIGRRRSRGCGAGSGRPLVAGGRPLGGEGAVLRGPRVGGRFGGTVMGSRVAHGETFFFFFSWLENCCRKIFLC